MPTLDLSRNILGAGADYRASDWGAFSASSGLNFDLVASLRHGVGVEAGVEGVVQLDASIRKFLAADVTGQAHAAARVAARVAVPLDLFTEAGFVAQAEARAEAAVGITAGIGLSLGDFIELVEQDPHMRGLPVRLLRVFLEEATIQGGVMAKAAAAAMAYANLGMTGTLVASQGTPAGFTVAAEAGLGLKAGAGFRVFARFGIDDPRRLIRRSVDVTVNETIAAVTSVVPPEYRQVVAELRAPAKMALRTAFELGLTLAENRGTFSASDGPKIALRCTQVFLEEAQRFILERVTELGLRLLREALLELEFGQSAWDQAQPERQHLASLLENFPVEPFEPTPENTTYWLDVVRGASDVAVALGAANQASATWVEPAAFIWAAVQLLFVSVRRISEASARASIIGMPPAETRRAFSGDITTPTPPAAIKGRINAALGRQASTTVRQQDLVAFLVRGAVLDQLDSQFPELRTVLEIVAGPDAGALSAALSTILDNIGAFSSGPSGAPDPEESLRTIVNGLRAYMATRVDGELRPAILDAFGDRHDDVRLFIDEVLLDTVGFTVNVLFDRVLDWANNDLSGQTALREACSSIAMRLIGRSLVATGDVLMTKALEGTSAAFREAAEHVNDPGGVAQILAGLPGVLVSREMIAEALEETLKISADVFGPLPETKRARIRDLLYQVIDTTPAGAGVAFVDQLKNDLFVPNGEAAIALGLELGGVIATNIQRFITALLEHIAQLILAELAAIVDEIVREIGRWIEGLEQLAAEVFARLQALVAEIGRLAQQLEASVDQTLGQIEDLLGIFAARAGARNALRDDIKNLIVDEAIGLLSNIPGYDYLPSDARRGVRQVLRSTVGSALNNDLFDGVVEVLGDLAGETAEFLEDVRAIDPNDNLTDAIIDLFLDRVEDAIRGLFGSSNPGVDISFRAAGIEFDLGRVRVPLGTVVTAARRVARNLSAVEDAARALADTVADMLQAELGLQAAEAEHAVVDAQRERVDRQMSETLPASIDLTIVEPAAASVYERDGRIRILLPGVPRSYLGAEEDEAQRVFVWINEEEVDLAQFDVDDIGGGALVDLGGRVLPGAPGTRPNLFGGASTLGALSIGPGGIRTGDPFGSTHPLALGRAKQRDQIKAQSRPGGLSVEKTPGAPLVPRIGSADRGTPASFGLGRADLTIGRGFTPMQVRELRETAFPGIALSGGLPLQSLREGVNTLSVAVVDGRGRHRIEKTVSFLAVDPPKSPAPGRIVRRPGTPAWDLGAMPAGMKRDVTRLFGESSLRASAAAGPVRAPAGPKPSRFGMPTRAERTAGLRASRDRVRRLTTRAGATAAAAQAIKQGKLRPVAARPK
jgi:hypothetical protein